ncbi:MAG: hypothetical protein ACI4CY_03165 [Candidatus Gastranaerophilaceae bacterium]
MNNYPIGAGAFQNTLMTEIKSEKAPDGTVRTLKRTVNLGNIPLEAQSKAVSSDGYLNAEIIAARSAAANTIAAIQLQADKNIENMKKGLPVRDYEPSQIQFEQIIHYPGVPGYYVTTGSVKPENGGVPNVKKSVVLPETFEHVHKTETEKAALNSENSLRSGSVVELEEGFYDNKKVDAEPANTDNSVKGAEPTEVKPATVAPEDIDVTPAAETKPAETVVPVPVTATEPVEEKKVQTTAEFLDDVNTKLCKNRFSKPELFLFEKVVNDGNKKFAQDLMSAIYEDSGEFVYDSDFITQVLKGADDDDEQSLQFLQSYNAKQKDSRKKFDTSDIASVMEHSGSAQFETLKKLVESEKLYPFDVIGFMKANVPDFALPLAEKMILSSDNNLGLECFKARSLKYVTQETLPVYEKLAEIRDERGDVRWLPEQETVKKAVDTNSVDLLVKLLSEKRDTGEMKYDTSEVDELYNVDGFLKYRKDIENGTDIRDIIALTTDISDEKSKKIYEELVNTHKDELESKDGRLSKVDLKRMFRDGVDKKEQATKDPEFVKTMIEAKAPDGSYLFDNKARLKAVVYCDPEYRPGVLKMVNSGKLDSKVITSSLVLEQVKHGDRPYKYDVSGSDNKVIYHVKGIENATKEDYDKAMKEVKAKAENFNGPFVDDLIAKAS